MHFGLVEKVRNLTCKNEMEENSESLFSGIVGYHNIIVWELEAYKLCFWGVTARDMSPLMNSYKFMSLHKQCTNIFF